MRSFIKSRLNAIGVQVHYRPPKQALKLSSINGRYRTLVAGPFLGEFGWELMQWQGYVRQLSKFYERIVVHARPSSEYFYQDFAAEFVPVTHSSWDTDGYELHRFDYGAWASQIADCDLLVADKRCQSLSGLINQQFVPFGRQQAENAYDLVVHARDIPRLEGNTSKWTRNWPNAHWDSLCQSLPDLRIAAIGVKALSYAPKGTVDLRGVETETLCSVLASSKVCVGPSSGVMHLASLCRTPHVVWLSGEHGWGFGGTAFRYTRSWNPFATKVMVLEAMGWQPTAEYVRRNLLEFLARLDSPQVSV